jgi:hypothetical protein
LNQSLGITVWTAAMPPATPDFLMKQEGLTFETL